MKLILSALFLILAVVLTAGLYLTVRKPDDRKADRTKLYGLFRPISRIKRQLRDFLFKILHRVPDAAINRTDDEPNAAAG
jgi:hypothetical protein